ncbi:hypothetical protein VNI00_010373 [Paramarasmius palmivorus]|uniref:Uncharacterized protein n=1 Tax=Paramarasmius palmivorus TaxID=297713 RepID=A0AAW0CM97_9AGAR
MTRRDMAVQTAFLPPGEDLAHAQEHMGSVDEIVRQEQALGMIREWNKTLRMSVMKRSGPWELADLPIQYQPPIPSLQQYHAPPVFIFGAPFTYDEIVDFTKKLGRYEEVLHKKRVHQNLSPSRNHSKTCRGGL